MQPRSIIYLGFVVITVLMLLMTSIALYQMHSMGNQLRNVVTNYEKKASLMIKMRTAARERIRLLHSMLSMNDPFEIDTTIESLQEFGAEFLKYRSELKSMQLSSHEEKLLQMQREISREAVRDQRNAIELIQFGSFIAASRVVLDKATPSQDKALKIMDDFIRYQKESSSNELNDSISSLDKSRFLLLITLFAAIILSIFIGKFVNKNITYGFNKVSSSEARERAIRDNMIEGLITIDENGIITSSNISARKMFNYLNEEMIGKNVSMLMPKPFKDKHDDYLKSYLNGNEPKVIGIGREVVGRKKDGSEFPIDLAVSELMHEDKRLFIGNLEDITERKKAQEDLIKSYDELERKVDLRTQELSQANAKLKILIQEKIASQEKLTYLANYDDLTGLPNRVLFYEQLNSYILQCKRNSSKFALLFLDLDGFKLVNDKFGHKTGDDLLKEVALRLKNCLRESDNVARLGGDEFTVISAINSNEIKNTDIVAKKIIQEISNPYSIGENLFEIGTSIGISIYPDDAHEEEQLIAYADEAMYSVKKQGKNNFTYYQDVNLPA